MMILPLMEDIPPGSLSNWLDYLNIERQIFNVEARAQFRHSALDIQYSKFISCLFHARL